MKGLKACKPERILTVGRRKRIKREGSITDLRGGTRIEIDRREQEVVGEPRFSRIETLLRIPLKNLSRQRYGIATNPE